MSEDDGSTFLSVDCGRFHGTALHFEECAFTPDNIASLLAAEGDGNGEVEPLRHIFDDLGQQSETVPGPFTIYGVTKSYDLAASSSPEQRLQQAVQREFARICSKLNVSPAQASLWVQGSDSTAAG